MWTRGISEGMIQLQAEGRASTRVCGTVYDGVILNVKEATAAMSEQENERLRRQETGDRRRQVHGREGPLRQQNDHDCEEDGGTPEAGTKHRGYAH